MFGAVCASRDTGVALIMPQADTAAMQAHLDAIGRSVAAGAHALLVLDKAGWHTTRKLRPPANITLVPLPPACPELNPAENVWRTVKTGEAGAPDRPIAHVEQRWFVGAHANVGGGYASDPLSQRPLVWLMDKAGARGLAYRDTVDVDTAQIAPPINDSYREFGKGFYHFFSKPFYRGVGAAPEKGTAATTSRINETIDGSVFDRWRADDAYRPPNLVAWAQEMQVDPAKLFGAVMAADPKVIVQ